MNKYEKIAKFNYLLNSYALFIDKYNKLFFLRIKDNNKYYYPTLKELIILSKKFIKEELLNIEKQQNQKVHFIPKIKYYGVLINISIILSTSLIKGIKLHDDNLITKITQEISDEDKKYFKSITPGDDEFDFKYSSDYEEYLNITYFRDASTYKQIFGYDNVKYEDIVKVVNQNNNLSPKYKNFIINFVYRWLHFFPNTNFTVLYHNLKTLKITELSEKELLEKTQNSNIKSQYNKLENTIYTYKYLDLNIKSNGYIILTHELLHVAKNTHFKKDGKTMCGSFFINNSLGLYTEEALNTYFCYLIQDLNNNSTFYTRQYNIIKIILKCIDYNGADFINHSINYFIDEMDKYMNDKHYAYRIIALFEVEATIEYDKDLSVNTKEFSELYEYITKMYIKKYIASKDNTNNSEDFKKLIESINNNLYEEVDTDIIHNAYNKYYNQLKKNY